MLASVWKWFTSFLNEEKHENENEALDNKEKEEEENHNQIIQWSKCSIQIGKSPKTDLLKKHQQLLLRLMQRKYTELVQKTGHHAIPLKLLLPNEIAKLMQPATHFIFHLVTRQNQKIALPFSFYHLDDLFPAADPSLFDAQVNQDQDKEYQATLVWTKGGLPDIDKSTLFQPFLYNSMAPGYPAGKGFRPHAWTWLFTSFAKGNSSCLLRLTKHIANDASHDVSHAATQVAYLLLDKPQPIVWLQKQVITTTPTVSLPH